MPSKKSTLLNDLSTSDLKRLLVARERIDVLESDRSRLLKELEKVEKELSKLMDDGVGGKTSSGKSTRRKKSVKKKTTKKTSRKTVKKTVKKGLKKKAAAKKPVRRKVVKKRTTPVKAGRNAPRGKATGAARMKLEDVIVAVIKKNGGPIAFQDLKARIVKGKLFKTKSGNFDNVLRRTLSTSKLVKRVGRGIYDTA